MADYNDYFNRPDAASPSTNAPYPITTLIGSAELKSNAVHDTDTTATTDTALRMEQVFSTPDHEVSVRLSTVTLNGVDDVGGGPIINCDVGATPNFLLAQCNLRLFTISILSMVANVFNADLADSATLAAFAVGDIVTIGRLGQYVYALRNGITVASARTNLNVTNVRGGVYLSRNTVNVDVAWNAWHAQEQGLPPQLSAPNLFHPLGFLPFQGNPPDTAPADIAQLILPLPVLQRRAQRGWLVSRTKTRARVPEPADIYLPTVRRQRTSVARRRSVWDVIPTTVVVVVAARAPDWLARPHRLRGMIRARRGLPVIAAPTDAVPKNRARTAGVLRSRRALSSGAVPSAPSPIIASTKGKRSGIGALRRSSSSRAAVTGLTPITAITRSRRSIGGLRRGVSRVLPADTLTAPAQIVRPDPLRPSLTRRGRVRNFVQAQVVIPRAPDWLARPHRVRGWRFVRGHRAEFPTPQATTPPPTLPLPVIQKRAQRGWLRLRGRSAEFPPAQVIITPTLPLPVVQKRALRGWWNRRPHPQIVLDQAAPPTLLATKRAKPTAQSKRTAPLSHRRAELVPRAAAGRRFASTKKPRRAELVPVPVVTVPYPLARPVYQRRLVWRRVGRYVAFPWVTNVIIIAAGYQHKVDFTDASVETYTESARVDYTEP